MKHLFPILAVTFLFTSPLQAQTSEPVAEEALYTISPKAPGRQRYVVNDQQLRRLPGRAGFAVIAGHGTRTGQPARLYLKCACQISHPLIISERLTALNVRPVAPARPPCYNSRPNSSQITAP